MTARLEKLCSEARAWFKPGRVILTVPAQVRRIQTCAECDQLQDDGGSSPLDIRCKACNCPLATKTAMPEAKCPKGKWEGFFASPENRKRLVAEAESWKGTRFAPACGANSRKGVVCDCVGFVHSVFVTLGVIKPIDWPAYVIRGGGAPMLELLLSVLDSIPEIVRAQTPFHVGDILVISSGRALHHLAIFTGDNTVWHALSRVGVCSTNVHDPIVANHTVAVYRAK